MTVGSIGMILLVGKGESSTIFCIATFPGGKSNDYVIVEDP